jgi:thiamine pyrophosphate-dependent acetolactate synthase large subunit-like protein
MNRSAGRADVKVMNRADLTRRIVARLKDDEAVIGGIGHTNFDLWACGHRPQNFYMLGSMGLACPIALGVALAQPQRRVVALEGDGSLLMQLGALATVATLAPKNLVVFVWDNGCYQITGSQPTLTSTSADLVAVAKGCGLARSFWAKDESDFEQLLDITRTEDGPWLIAARTDDRPPAKATERDPAQIRDRFMRGLGTKQPWPLLGDVA